MHVTQAAESHAGKAEAITQRTIYIKVEFKFYNMKEPTKYVKLKVKIRTTVNNIIF